jgi:hypothetical protein
MRKGHSFSFQTGNFSITFLRKEELRKGMAEKRSNVSVKVQNVKKVLKYFLFRIRLFVFIIVEFNGPKRISLSWHSSCLVSTAPPPCNVKRNERPITSELSSVLPNCR